MSAGDTGNDRGRVCCGGEEELVSIVLLEHLIVSNFCINYIKLREGANPESKLQEPTFKTTATNPFTELTELRFEIRVRNDDLDVHCRLLFGRMHYEYNDREYEIGLRRAHLRLFLEGCETTLEPAYGENQLPSVIEQEALVSNTNLGASITASGDTSFSVGAKPKIDIGACKSRQHSNNQKRERLPMTRKPGDSWEVLAQSVDGSAGADLDGTAISGQKLCTLQRTDGGNRIAATGEVQVAKAAISVSAKGGNHLGKALAEWQNKDAIVSQILKRALQREALGGAARKTAKVVVVSKVEVSEE